MRLAIRLALAAALALVALAPQSAEAGGRRAKITVTAPVHGVFTTAANVTVTGQVQNAAPGTAVVTVNGTAVPVNPDGSFSHVVTLNPSIVFNPIETRLVAPVFQIDRRVVVSGPVRRRRRVLEPGPALRLNDSGLDELEPVVTSLVDLDLATLLPPNTLVIDNYCYATIIGRASDAWTRSSRGRRRRASAASGSTSIPSRAWRSATSTSRTCSCAHASSR